MTMEARQKDDGSPVPASTWTQQPAGRQTDIREGREGLTGVYRNSSVLTGRATQNILMYWAVSLGRRERLVVGCRWSPKLTSLRRDLD